MVLEMTNFSGLPRMFLSLAVALGLSACASRQLSQPPLGEDAPYEGEAEDIQESIRLMSEIQNKVAAVGGMQKPLRGAHAKGHGCAKGVLVPLTERAASTRVGVFEDFQSFDFYARFSNAGSTLSEDANDEPRGLSIKINKVAGNKLWSADGDSDSLDLFFVSLPIFPAATVADYNSLMSSRGLYFLRHPFLALKVKGLVPKDVTSLLDHRYFSMGAVKWGNGAAKLSLKPCSSPVKRFLTEEQREANPKDFLSQELGGSLKNGQGCFELSAQFQKDPVLQPVEDITVVWEEKDTPFVPFAKLLFPAQAVEPSKEGSQCEKAAFNPWRTVAEHRPMGALNRARKAVYEASEKLRRQ